MFSIILWALWFERAWTGYPARARGYHRYLVSLHTPTHHIARYLWLSALVCYWTRIFRMLVELGVVGQNHTRQVVAPHAHAICPLPCAGSLGEVSRSIHVMVRTNPTVQGMPFSRGSGGLVSVQIRHAMCHPTKRKSKNRPA